MPRFSSIPRPPSNQNDWQGMLLWMEAVTDYLTISEGERDIRDRKPTVRDLQEAEVLAKGEQIVKEES